MEYFETLIGQFQNPVTAIAQMLGFVPLFLSWFIFRAKTRKTSIAIKAISDGFSAIHFFMLGEWPGCAINCINTVRGALFSQKGRHKWASGLYLPIGFCAVTVCSSILSWTGFESILPMVGSCLAVVGYWQTSQKSLRRFNFAGIFLWLIYGIITFSIPTMIGNTISLSSIVVSEIRDAKAAKKEQAND